MSEDASRFKVVAGLLFLLLFSRTQSKAQPLSDHAATPPDISAPAVETALRVLESADWETRSAGFYRLIKLGLTSNQRREFALRDSIQALANQSQELRALLISNLNRLLSVEEEFERSGESPSSEDYSEYYANLIWAVTTLQDPSSLSVLLDVLNSGGMATSAVSGFGDHALEAAVGRLTTADSETHYSLLLMLTQMTEPLNMAHLQKKESMSLLVDTLISGANNTNPHIREMVIDGLARIDTPDAISTLQRLASSDPYVIRRSSGTNYPVREAAAKALLKR